MAVVKCVTMQRDETLLLEAWFRYYGYLFGFENLAVIDNGSSDPAVLATLARYERAGSQILRGLDTELDFYAKGDHFRNLLTHWDGLSDYDFALPVDADEFLALFTPDGLTCRRDAIHAYLDGLRGTQQALSFELSLFNSPGKPGCFAVQDYRKTFLPARSVAEIDRGLHSARSRLADGRRHTDLTYLHFHNKPFETLLHQARQKLRGVVDVNDPDALRAHQGAGVHMVRYFFMTEADYLRQHESELLLRFPQFDRVMAAFGVRSALVGGDMDDAGSGREPDAVWFVPPRRAFGDAVRFVPRAYGDSNPDVRDAGWNPIHHYVAHGYREGRTIPVRLP